MRSDITNRQFGFAWMALCIAFILHVVDEALTEFLAVYNPTVLALRTAIPWLPMPVFRFEIWLAGLIVANALLLALSPCAFRGARWMRPLAYLFAAIMILNGIGHILGTIAGQTVDSVRFQRPMPGFYSSPILLASALYLLSYLRKSTGDRSRQLS